MAIFFLGFGITTVNMPVEKDQNFESISGQVLLKIATAPRRNTPGGITTLIEVDSKVTLNQDLSYRLTKLARPVKLTCRAVELPWRNITNAKAGDWYFATIKTSPLPDTSWGHSMYRKGVAAQCRIQLSSPPLHKEQSLITSLRERLRNRIVKNAGDNENSGLLRALVLGQRDTLTRQTEESFKRTALAHLLVVSGYHISISYTVLFALLSLIFASYKQKLMVRAAIYLIPLAVCTLQVFVAGAEPPAVRALTAISLYAVFQLSDRTPNALHALLLSLLLLCCLWPTAFLDLGVQFTYAALLGIILACTPTSSSHVKSGTTQKLASYLKLTTLPSLTTGLVSLIYFNYISLIGFILQPTLAPLIALIGCKLGLIALMLDFLTGGQIDHPIPVVVSLLGYLKDFVTYLASFELAILTAEGATKYLLLALGALFISRLIWKRACRYQHYYNLN